jgi:beta-fructofuranosidase
VPVALSAPDSYRAIVGAVDVPAEFHLRAEIDIAAETGAVGLLLRADADGEQSGIIRLEPRRHRVVFDRWPRALIGTEQWQISGDVPFQAERPVRLDAGRHTVDVLTDGEILVVIVDRQVALSTRFYAQTGARLGFFTSDGDASLASLIVNGRN